MPATTAQTWVNWDEIKTVLLDMDGTLLDLHFDNYFWQHYVPLRYAEKHAISENQAKATLDDFYQTVSGSLNWYCIDYWTSKLDLDIVALKHEVSHLIAMRPDVEQFLNYLRERDKQIILVTNAHRKTLSLKLGYVALEQHFHAMICSHDFGMPKEDSSFWQTLQMHQPFEEESTLLIDDSLANLRSARHYGIVHLLGIAQPDSKKLPELSKEFRVLHSFSEIC